MEYLSREQLEELQTVLPLLQEIVDILEAAEDIGNGHVKIKVPPYLTAYFDKMFPNSRIRKEATNG